MGGNMDPFSPPYKTGFVGTVEVPKKKGDDVVEYAFEWHDGNPEDEDRSGYGVSVLDGKIVIGGSPIIGISTRVDEYDPSIQWVAIEGSQKSRLHYYLATQVISTRMDFSKPRESCPRYLGPGLRYY